VSPVLYSVTMSLDGFIAGVGGDMSWLADHAGPDLAAEELCRRTGSLLVGRRTYDGDDPNAGTDSEGAFGGAWSGPQFVLTHRPPAEPVPDVTFVGDLAEGVAAASAAAGGAYVNVLGAGVAAQCLAAGLLDEVLVFVVPVLLGDGTRLFDHPGGTRVRLERRSVGTAPGATSLWFRVAR
jgi:dihydrofolate reductase